MKPGHKAQAQREKGKLSGFTPAELAEHLGVSKRTLRRWQQEGSIPEPAARTESGWALWSVEQVRVIREWRLKRS